MLHVLHPANYEPERAYILDVLLRERLGLEYTTATHELPEVHLVLPNGGTLVMPDVLFGTPVENWLSQESLPSEPLDWWQIDAPLKHDLDSTQLRVPVVYGRRRDASWYRTDSSATYLGIDIFGAAFFQLSRYEEVVLNDLDDHERFPVSASLPKREDFLMRPMVDEYVALLKVLLRQLWPDVSFKQHGYRVILTHDVDRPLMRYRNGWRGAIASSLADVVRRKDPRMGLNRVLSYRRSMRGEVEVDLFNTFDFIMNLSEEQNLASEFYFIAGHTSDSYDATYTIQDEWIRNLMRRMHDRGHQLGLHPSYHTYQDATQTKREFVALRESAEQCGIEQAGWGGRQHYLRWRNPDTWQNWEDAGLNYDSTVSFARDLGFRCGTCHDFPVYNLETRQTLKLREKPLTFMESTALGYMKLSFQQTLAVAEQLQRVIRTHEGTFVFLWHNSSLRSQGERNLYAEIVRNVIAH